MFFIEAVITGLVLSIDLSVLSFVLGKIALDAFVDKYPEAIQLKFGPMSERARRLKPLFAGVIFAVTLATPLLGMQVVMPDVKGFLPAFVFAATVLMTFNVFDLLILDWLLFCTVRPRAMQLPGTEGMKEYGDYGFHFVGFLKGIVFTAVFGALIAGLWVGWKTFFE